MYGHNTYLIHFGARDYDPTIGRWTTKDPIGFAGGDTNLYAYVGGNPMSYVDPSGLTQQDLDNALGWLRNRYPTMISSSQSFSGFPLGSGTYGLAIGNNILINFSAIDNAFESGPERIAQYVRTLTHELHHSADQNRLGIINGILDTTEQRHEQIRSDSNYMGELYLGRLETQCKRRR